MTMVVSKSGFTMVHEEDQDLEASARTFGMSPSTALPLATTTIKPSASATNTTELLAVCFTPCAEGDNDSATSAVPVVSLSIPALTSPSMQYHSLGINTPKSAFILPTLDCSDTNKTKLLLIQTKEHDQSPHIPCFCLSIASRATLPGYYMVTEI
jgi:hypothetical protein